MSGVDELKSRFSSIVSHEMRTPLTVIRECIEMALEDSQKMNAGQKEVFDIAQRNVARLSGLIEDVLDYRRLSTGRVVLDPGFVSMNQLIRKAVRKIRPKATAKNLRLDLCLEPNLPPVWIDRRRILKVIDILLSNAFKFTKKGRIRIVSGRVGSLVKVGVHDTGSGIRRIDMGKLFESFSTLESKGNKRQLGSKGLGLATAKKIIALHRGAIHAKSKYGKGSIFSFSVPLTRPPGSS